MNKKYLFFTLLVIIGLTSCVPNKDIIYLQGSPTSLKEIKKVNKEPYKLKVDDIIFIELKSSINEELISLFSKGGNIGGNNMGNQQNNGAGAYFRGYSVDTHGNVRLPNIGEINVLGYTTKEVREKVENELLKFFQNKDDFFVTVKLAGIRYTIMGEIRNPGPNVIYQNRVSILEAISNSGDITGVGNRKNVEIIRFTPEGVKKYVINLTQIEAVDSEVFYIQSNDYINVKPLKQKSWGTGTTGLGSLSSIISAFTLVTSTILLIRNL